MAHAALSPSSASRWLHCPGSIAASRGIEDHGSDFAAKGTAAHFLAEQCLTHGHPADHFRGREIVLTAKDCGFCSDLDSETILHRFVVGDELIENVQKYVDFVRSIDGELLVEQRLPLTVITGEPMAFGTADAVILAGDELVIVDLKYGRGVQVDAVGNEQLAIYALAALREYEILGDFQRVRLAIVQPRLGHISEWVLPVDGDKAPTLRAFAEHIAPRCERALAIVQGAEPTVADFSPGEKACQWCKAKATCQALADKVLTTVADDFVDTDEPIAPQIEHAPHRTFDNTTLGNMLAAVGLVEQWCAAIRAAAEEELLAGRPVPGFKLVEGRAGARKWADPAEAEAMLKQMRLKDDELYDRTLISPTTAEKLHKAGRIGPRQWPRVLEAITRASGKPTVVPESDKRPALAPTSDDFAVVDDLV